MKLENVKPTDEELRVMLESGFVLRDAGRLDDAEAVFRGVTEVIPHLEIPWVALSTIEMLRGRFADAQALCERAMTINPESLYARVHYAESLLFQRKRNLAEAELHAIIEADAESPHSRTAQTLLEAADLICDIVANSSPSGVP
jgi:predicted Zn-dependent protease